MNIRSLRASLKSFDPKSGSVASLGRQVATLRTLVELLLDEVERLTDEHRHLLGEPPSGSGENDRGGILDQNAGEAAPAKSDEETSAEATPEPARPKRPKPERPKPDPDDKAPHRGARPKIDVHETRKLGVDPALVTGGDWRRHGFVDRLIQDVLFVPRNILFRCERWYSAEQGKTLVAELPAGYDQGSYGPHIKQFTLHLGHACRVPLLPLTHFLRQAKVSISASTVNGWLSGKQLLSVFHTEADELFQAGMKACSWVGHDVTSTQVNGANWSCHGLNNLYFSAFHTVPGQDRWHTLEAFQGRRPMLYRFDAVSAAEMEHLSVPKGLRGRLNELAREQSWTEAEFGTLLEKHCSNVGDANLKKIRDAAAMAAFRHRDDCATPIVTLKDDAAAAAGLTVEEQICWWHESRLYEALPIGSLEHDKRIKQFLRCYWKLYRQINEYRKAPTPKRAKMLEGRFERLMRCRHGIPALEERARKTLNKKERMLTVLRHPSVPMHNNGQERALRSRARRRDVSYQTRSESGVWGWDTMEAVFQTAWKLGINTMDYVLDRLTRRGAIPRLADLIAAKSQGAAATPG